MKFTTARELQALKKVNESTVNAITKSLNDNFMNGYLSEERVEKAFAELDNLIEKAGKKYYKRTGTPGNYKYYYTKEQYDKEANVKPKTLEQLQAKIEGSPNGKAALSNLERQRYNKLMGERDKKRESQKKTTAMATAAREGAKKKFDITAEIVKIGESGKMPSEHKIKELSIMHKDITGKTYSEAKIKEAMEASIEAHKEAKEPKHIGDMTLAEKRSAAAELGIEGHDKISEKELNVKLIDANIDKELGKIKKSEEEVALDSQEAIDILKGGKRAQIGEIREFAGRKHIKTASGWKYYGKGTGSKAQSHSKNGGNVKPIDKTSLVAREIQTLKNKGADEHLIKKLRKLNNDGKTDEALTLIQRAKESMKEENLTDEDKKTLGKVRDLMDKEKKKQAKKPTSITYEEHGEIYSKIGRGGLGYEFNYNPRLNGYIVPKAHESFSSVKKDIEENVPGYTIKEKQYQSKTQTSGTKAGWMDGPMKTVFEVMKK